MYLAFHDPRTKGKCYGENHVAEKLILFIYGKNLEDTEKVDDMFVCRVLFSFLFLCVGMLLRRVCSKFLYIVYSPRECCCGFSLLQDFLTNSLLTSRQKQLQRSSTIAETHNSILRYLISFISSLLLFSFLIYISYISFTFWGVFQSFCPFSR